jgi:hypothetical protein
MPTPVNFQNTNGTKETSVSASPRNIIMSYLSNFLQDNNLVAVISDDTDESILITQNATYKGQEEIKTFFAGLIDNAFSKATIEL